MKEGLTGLDDKRVINDRIFIFEWTIPLSINICIFNNVHYHSKMYFKKLILLFSKDALNLSNIRVKTLIMLQKISISN